LRGVDRQMATVAAEYENAYITPTQTTTNTRRANANDVIVRL
jgi:hypothetical protein